MSGPGSAALREKKPEAGPLRLILTLGLAGLVSGVAIVGIYLVTLPRIRKNQAEALARAIDQVLDLDPSTSTKRVFVLRDGKLVAYERGLEEGLPAEEAVYAGYDGAKRLVGFAVPADAPGFQDTIKLIYGYDPRAKQLLGMQVLESRETPGLGDKIIKDAKFVGQFRALAAEPEVVPVKPGTRAKPHEVDVISGATISSKAVVKAINRAHRRWASLLEAALEEATR